MILKPFQRYARIPILCKQSCSIFVTCENLEFYEALPTIKRDLRGQWYVLIPPYVKVGPYRKRYDASYIKKIKQLKFVVIRKRNAQKQVLYDINLYFKIANRYNPTNSITRRILTSVFSSGNPVTWFHFIDLTKNAPDFRKSLLYPIFFYSRLSENYATDHLPKNIIFVTTANGKIVKYIPVRIDGSSWNYARCLALYKRILSSAKEIATVVDDVTQDKIEKVVDNAVEVINQKTPELSKDVVETLIKSATIDKETAREIVSSNRINVGKVIEKSIQNVTVPESSQSLRQRFDTLKNNVIKVDTVELPQNNVITPVIKNILPPVNISSYSFRKSESKKIDELFKKISSKLFLNNGFRVKQIRTRDLPPPDNEISKTHKLEFIVDLEDVEGQKHTLTFRIPKILDDGTMLVNNNRYIVPLQLKNLPITFPKPGVAKFESYTCSMLFERLKTRFKVMFVGYSFPIGLFLCYVFGFKRIFDHFKIKYAVSESKTSKVFVKLSRNLYLNIVSDLNEVQGAIVDNLLPFKDLSTISSEPLSNEWFAEIINKYTGNKYTSVSINNVVHNAVDDRTLEILKDKGLPTNFYDICMYMLEGIFKGYLTPRENVQYQRIRSYEMVLNVAFDVIRRTVAEYNRNIKYGKKATLRIDPDYPLQQIVTSGALQILEQGNPIEELYGFNKATYSSYRGIPSDSVPEAIRSINPTYFGVIDPVDTPEGANIGVNNSLTLGAIIATKYGSVIPKKISDDVSFDVLAITTSTIPFLSKNEPTRALMAANQVRQAVLIKNNQPPLVQTGIEATVPSLLKTDTFVKKARCNGKVLDVTKDLITIACSTGEIKKIDIKPSFGYSGSSLNTYVSYKPTVRKGQKVTPETIVATTPMFRNSTLAMGTNALVAYAFWKGYNFEDGIVVSRSFAKNLTSSHVKKLFIFVDPQDKLVKLDIPKGEIKAGHVFATMVSNVLSEVIDSGLVSSENILVKGNRFKITAPFDGRVLKYEIYSNVSLDRLDPSITEKFKQYNVKNGTQYVYKGKKYEGIFIYIYYQFDLPLSLGDKLTNRHAAKGVVTRIEKDSEMPVLPDGRRVDVIINPISVINRSNLGQIYELYTGEVAYQLTKRISKMSRPKFIELLKQVLVKISPAYAVNLIRYLSTCSSEKYKEFVNFCTKFGFPIVVMPFKEPNFKQLLAAMKVLGIPERYKLKISGTTIEAACGYQYIYKLEHIAANKIHSRSIGPYVSKTGQPTAGKAAEGGQRVGEFDMWSLASYDAENIIQEFFSAASDDQELKRLMYRQIINTGETSISVIGKERYTVKNLLDKYMKSILIDMEV